MIQFLQPTLAPLVSAALLAVPALGQVYSYDDGATEDGLSITGVTEMGFLHGFVATGGTDTIREIRVAIGSALAPAHALDGDLLRIAIWDDPNNDGHPSDAVLLYESGSTSASETNLDTKVSYPITPTVAVTGVFFVGIAIESTPGEFPVGLDTSSAGNGAVAYVFGNSGAIDLASLLANSSPPNRPSPQSHAVFLLDAIGDGGTTIGAVYCTPAVANSTGAPAHTSANGSAVVAHNDLQLSVSSLPSNTFGYFLGSRTQALAVAPGGSQGNLCLGGSIGRFLQQIQNSGTGGQFAIQVDLDTIPQPLGSVAVMPGQSWNFQCWYRDANPGTISNFSDAISVTFL